MNDNFEFIVLTCDKYLNTRVSSIKKTWGSELNIKFITDTNIDNENIIAYNTQKNYNGIYDKYFNFFKSYNFTKKYYFFTDDDTFVNLKNLSKLDIPSEDFPFLIGRLLQLNQDGTDLWGQQTGTNINQITGENTTLPINYTSGGSGFILSKSACFLIQNYLKSTKNPPKSIFGDLTIGFWCRNNGVQLIPNNNFWWDTHEKLLSNNVVPYKSDENIITFHYVGEKLMENYHLKYNH